jgi:cell cycle protein kinase DBF2
MSNFLTNLFPSSQGGKNEITLPAPPLTLQTRSDDQFGERPNTPTRNSFITPVSTPQGSPSKKQNPPGANDLPTAFESAMTLNSSTLGSPSKLGRQAGTPLSPGKSNTLAGDDSYFGNSATNIDDSIIHKSAVPSGSPLRKQGKENTPPSSRQGLEPMTQNQAAISRQEQYQSRDQPQITKKYNTQRGLTPDELEILHKPNVKRLANVTQLCKKDTLGDVAIC